MATSYTSSTDMLLSSLSERVLTLTLNRPDALNALRPEMFVAMKALVEEASGDDEVAVIVIEGSGRAFSAGVDLKVLQGIDPKAGKIGDVFDVPAAQAYDALRKSPKPVIAKVHGACFTGALEMALHCDFIFTTVDSKFGDTHAKFGLRPTWGMSQTLSQAIGVRKAKEMSFSARTVRGGEAAELGIANTAVADKDALDDLVRERCSQIAGNSTAAVAAFKDLYNLAQEGKGIEDALSEELAREYAGILDTNERLAGF
ncbi:MAG: enoyl-CoA hydratase/isomerase family protein [Pseudomonadaceae bacterium]|nr:enoyl-CoA hydratase/isomerase family protein [Pseudomonadaceae bacterium]